MSAFARLGPFIPVAGDGELGYARENLSSCYIGALPP
jgi:hypothetical protein